MLPCPSSRSIRAFLMWSPSVRGSQLFVFAALRQRDPGGSDIARVARKALGDCQRSPVRLKSRHSRLLPASARASRTGVFPPVNPSRPAHSPQSTGCRLQLSPQSPRKPTGAPRTALPPGADRRPARATRPLRKGIERLILCAVACRTQESVQCPNNNTVDENALLRFYRQQNVLMS
jgi:hypothetical protein